jgi:hypothetical protein
MHFQWDIQYKSQDIILLFKIFLYPTPLTTIYWVSYKDHKFTSRGLEF